MRIRSRAACVWLPVEANPRVGCSHGRCEGPTLTHAGRVRVGCGHASLDSQGELPPAHKLHLEQTNVFQGN